MSEVKKGFGADILAKLRGVGTGGVNAPKPEPQTVNQPTAQEQQTASPKRDIQELYDFIDAYCSPEE